MDASPAPAIASTSPNDGDGPDTGDRAVVRRVGLDLDRDAAWDLVGTGDGLARWLGTEVDLDPAAGGALRVVEHDGTVRTGVVHEVEAGRRLAFEWTDADGLTSAVDITVDDTDEGTARVTVTERVAVTGGRACARLDAGSWDDRLLALEVAGLDRSALVAGAVGAVGALAL